MLELEIVEVVFREGVQHAHKHTHTHTHTHTQTPALILYPKKIGTFDVLKSLT